ncbi:MAG: hypothetical protein GX562_01355 [Coriobacteriaceae bacterium]|nr:hypothetical protein [Coriobacteriaceae bacterium]
MNRRIRGEEGQGTVEYLIVGLILMVVVSVLGLLSGKVGDALFARHAVDSASHALTTNTAGVVGDVLLF